MATKPRENSARVLLGDAPGGVPEIVFKQLGVLLAIVFLYISLWMILDDSAKLPGTKVQEPHPIAMPKGYMHEVSWTPELKAIREAEAKKIASWDAGKIPVDKAMTLLTQRGLPTKVLPEAKKQIDLALTSTEANGGQIQWMSQPAAGHTAPAAAHGAAPAAHGQEAHGVAPAEHGHEAAAPTHETAPAGHEGAPAEHGAPTEHH